MGKMPFEKLYDQNYFKVLQFLVKRMGNYHDAEDLASDCFVYCYDHYDSFDPERSSETTWLYMVVRSRLKNYYRDHRQTSDIGELENELFSEPDMDRAIWLEQMQKAVKTALDQIPEKQRIAVTMRYFQEKSFEEIAEELQSTQGNVRVILSRALDRLEGLCKDFV